MTRPPLLCALLLGLSIPIVAQGSETLSSEFRVHRYRSVACRAGQTDLVITSNSELLEVVGCGTVRVEGDRNWLRIEGDVEAVVLSGCDNVVVVADVAKVKLVDTGQGNVLIGRPGAEAP